MRHYIIVKFKEGYDYLKELDAIRELFQDSLKIEGVHKVEMYPSNSKRSNRHDLMIMMELTQDGLLQFDQSLIHQQWKEIYGKEIESKTIFDCDL